MDRREFIIGIATGLMLGPRIAMSEAWLFLTPPEAAFITAAIEVMIPADDMGPGGVEVGVVQAIDRQLAGAFGAGAGLYLRGPWQELDHHHGWQNSLTPAEFYRMAISETDALARESTGFPFASLSLSDRDCLLSGLAEGDMALANLWGVDFVQLLWTNAQEAYFGDPAYGGNRDMAVWRMIGFPGIRHGTPTPLSLADLQ